MTQGLLISFVIGMIFFSTQKENNKILKEKRELDKKKYHTKEIESNAEAFQDIAHEIRTPLTLIISPLEDELNKTNNPNISIALKNSKRLYQLVNQLLEVHHLFSE